MELAQGRTLEATRFERIALLRVVIHWLVPLLKGFFGAFLDGPSSLIRNNATRILAHLNDGHTGLNGTQLINPTRLLIARGCRVDTRTQGLKHLQILEEWTAGRKNRQIGWLQNAVRRRIEIFEGPIKGALQIRLLFAQRKAKATPIGSPLRNPRTDGLGVLLIGLGGLAHERTDQGCLDRDIDCIESATRSLNVQKIA